MAMGLELLKSLFHIKRLMFQEINKIFAAEGLNSTEVMILHRLRHGNCKVSDLANEMGIPFSTLTGIMDRMVEKGLITRERNEDDRRVVTVGLSRHLKEKYMPSPVLEYLQEILADTPPGWAEQFIAQLHFLEDLLEKRGENTIGR